MLFTKHFAECQVSRFILTEFQQNLYGQGADTPKRTQNNLLLLVKKKNIVGIKTVRYLYWFNISKVIIIHALQNSKEK